MISLLEQAREEGRQQQRENQDQMSSMAREELLHDAWVRGLTEGERNSRHSMAMGFLMGIIITICLYEMIFRA